MDSKNKFEEQIVNRLNVLISLILDQSSREEGLSMTDKISRLEALGVPHGEIARILGKSLNYVTATLSQRKSRKKVKTNG